MTVSIGLGLSDFPFLDASDYWRWVDMCEAGGVDSLWQTDRLVSRHAMLECLTTMAAMAGRTRRIKFGMNALSLALRDPVLVAKQCATIDFLSNGRLLPSFGVGSPHGPEWQTLDIDTRTRGRRTDEALDVISRLWVEESVDYEGRHFRLKGASISPKPVQANLPMWIGGGSPAAVRRTARIGTGWIGGPETPEATAPIIQAIHAALRESGREIDHDHYGAGFPIYFGAPSDPILESPMAAYVKRTGNDPLDYFAVGDADAIVGRVEQYIAAGVSKFILRPVGTGDAVLSQTRRLIDEVIPRVPA